jgi:hypothetical protein
MKGKTEMKTAMKIICAIAMLFSVSINAQELARPTRASLLGYSGGFRVPGSFTTNIPAAYAPLIPFTKNGLGIALRSVGTNAATTTNLTMVLEQVIVVDGLVQATDSALNVINISSAQNGTTPYDYFTNIVSTQAGFANSMFRVRSIQNTNLASIWITNAVAQAIQ